MPKTKIVMLTSLAGAGIDIQPGNICICSQEDAQSFLDARYARPFNAKQDEGRTEKHYPAEPEPETKPAKSEPKAAKAETKVAKADAKTPTNKTSQAGATEPAAPTKTKRRRAKSPAA
ncbi:hypothetical protein [Aureliella helgolandensis]|uniref:Uncharacterized protein n=1 Tax=Aureliella helgolandensis TaxID=2527968 RepID=A0A518G728_9BACT|nr:hypothetical protein [Aureliella helgolandensis]QDV24392.1 hypothetical protein Q31a_27090 [Aureliella helgolandensis]